MDTWGPNKKCLEQQGVHTSETMCGHRKQMGRAKSVHGGGVHVHKGGVSTGRGSTVLDISNTYQFVKKTFKQAQW